MIAIELIRNYWPEVAQNLVKRGVEESRVKTLFELDKQWREQTKQLEELRARQNRASHEVASLGQEDRQKKMVELKKLSDKIKQLTKNIQVIERKRKKAWAALPNLIMADVPYGGEKDSEVIKDVTDGSKLKSGRSYLELLEGSLIDLERPAKSSGSRFVTTKGQLVMLELALVRWAMERLQSQGFTPIITPALITAEAMQGMGYLDEHQEEVYHTQDNLYLIGTSEQSIGAQHMHELMAAGQLPLRYVGYSSCFRREVGSHGKDVKGMLRVHQFNKVEMFSLTTPAQSTNELEFILSQQEELMRQLKLPYRVIKLASLDLGRAAAKTYDIETWIPSEKRFRETHSCSNTTDYQARRLNIRVKGEEGNRILHMINGTAFAIGRTLIAIIENYQQEDGSITMPKVLQELVGFDKIPH